MPIIGQYLLMPRTWLVHINNITMPPVYDSPRAATPCKTIEAHVCDDAIEEFKRTQKSLQGQMRNFWALSKPTDPEILIHFTLDPTYNTVKHVCYTFKMLRNDHRPRLSKIDLLPACTHIPLPEQQPSDQVHGVHRDPTQVTIQLYWDIQLIQKKKIVMRWAEYCAARRC